MIKYQNDLEPIANRKIALHLVSFKFSPFVLGSEKEVRLTVYNSCALWYFLNLYY